MKILEQFERKSDKTHVKNAKFGVSTTSLRLRSIFLTTAGDFLTIVTTRTIGLIIGMQGALWSQAVLCIAYFRAFWQLFVLLDSDFDKI